MMLFIAPLLAALIPPLAIAAPAPGNTWGTGGGPPPGYYSVEDFCSTPTTLFCCNGIAAGGVAGEPTATNTGCVSPMAGGQETYEFGYCPYNYKPLCCEALLVNGDATGCGPATQVQEPSS